MPCFPTKLSPIFASNLASLRNSSFFDCIWMFLCSEYSRSLYTLFSLFQSLVFERLPNEYRLSDLFQLICLLVNLYSSLFWFYFLSSISYNVFKSGMAETLPKDKLNYKRKKPFLRQCLTPSFLLFFYPNDQCFILVFFWFLFLVCCLYNRIQLGESFLNWSCVLRKLSLF